MGGLQACLLEDGGVGGAVGDLHLSRVLGVAVSPSAEHASSFGNGGKHHVHAGKELALVIGAGELHAVDQDGAAAASRNADGGFALETKIVRQFLPESLGAVLGES